MMLQSFIFAWGIWLLSPPAPKRRQESEDV